MRGKKIVVSSKEGGRKVARRAAFAQPIRSSLRSGYLDAYAKLLLRSLPRPIRTKSEHAKALREIESMMTSPHLGKAESQYVELLSTLIEHYESQENPTPNVSQSQMLAHLIAERGVSQTLVAKKTSIARGTISNVLAGRRELSKQNIAKLSSYFKVSTGAWF